jgi:hypothetical protein
MASQLFIWVPSLALICAAVPILSPRAEAHGNQAKDLAHACDPPRAHWVNRPPGLGAITALAAVPAPSPAPPDAPQEAPLSPVRQPAIRTNVFAFRTTKPTGEPASPGSRLWRYPWPPIATMTCPPTKNPPIVPISA